jgi:hypothetical protein
MLDEVHLFSLDRDLLVVKKSCFRRSWELLSLEHVNVV